MAIIGNPIYQSAFVTDQFSGDGTTTAFTMSVSPAGVSNVLVAVSGVLQDPSTYGVVGTTINFSTAPPSGTGNISCRYLGVPVTGVTTTAYRTVTEFTATASQTTFTPPSYTVGFINVYRNGVLLGSADYTATNGTTVVLATGATSGDLVTVESFQVSSVVNAIQNTAGSVSGTNIATGAVTAAKLASGAVTAVKLDTTGTANSSTYLRGDMAWSALPASGKVLQVVQTVLTSATSVNTSGGFAQITGLATSITPSSASNKILVMMTISGGASNGYRSGVKLVRDSTDIFVGDSAGSRIRTTVFQKNTDSSNQASYNPAFIGLDSPATTSAVTYRVYASVENVSTFYVNQTAGDSDSTSHYRAASSLVLLEIAG